jgi:hypothetical protein
MGLIRPVGTIPPQTRTGEVRWTSLESSRLHGMSLPTTLAPRRTPAQRCGGDDERRLVVVAAPVLVQERTGLWITLARPQLREGTPGH